ncbi:MAG: M20/M25/M40 family metallo-hydrolase [Candidatus Heimdallarchaeota archaeon]|nr:M20/M25/M40 family metallo-hydrolase [Candidatus Heimdallarchaeota archaeon]
MSKAAEVIDERSVINLAKRLIKIESVSGDEKKLVRLLGIELKKAGFNFVKFDETNYNIVGVKSGTGRGKSLVLAGHLDTVPPGNMTDPFTAKEADGSKFGVKGKVIKGRGACDMKGALAAMIIAGQALKRARVRLKGDFIVIGLANSEAGDYRGFEDMLTKSDIKPDYIVSGEPTNLDIHIAHPGLAKFEIIARGKMANVGNPDRGVNAVLKMHKVLSALLEHTPKVEDDQFGEAEMVVSSICSNPPNNTHSVPDYCRALIVRQFFDGENPKKIEQELIKTLKKQGFTEQEVQVNLLTAQLIAPVSVDQDAEIISILQEVRKAILGKPANLGVWKSGINLSEYSGTDFPIVGFGPGNEECSHSFDEHVPVEQLIQAARVYAALAEKICTTKKE